MIIYVYDTINLGDFLNSMPVLSGISKSTNTKIDLLIRPEMHRFNGIIEFLQHQPIFNSVHFGDQHPHRGHIYHISSVTREDKNSPIRPTETCRFENYFRDNYNIPFDVDDDFVLTVPERNIPVKDTYYVGDRWAHALSLDPRRSANHLKFLTGVEFLDYNMSLVDNAHIIRHLTKPFITVFTGISVLADLLNVESYVVWKPEYWTLEHRVGDNITWDGGKNIDQVFAKHFYLNRKSKLMHERNLSGEMI